MTWRLLALLVMGAALQCTLRPATAADRQPWPRTVSRTILALYDGRDAADGRATPIHALAEMPLNHLGLVVRYHDIRTGLPTTDMMRDVRGVLTWFTSDAMPNARAYLRWVEAISQSGRPVVIIGTTGAVRDEDGTSVPLDEVNRALTRLGWRYDGGWHTTTAGTQYQVSNATLIGFERPLPTVVPPYASVRATAADAKTMLRVTQTGRPSVQSDLIIVSPRGAYVAPGFAFFADRAGDREFRQWYLNPFEFFRLAFGTDEVPKLDTATLNGRRIYYSHIDGDGWRNLTQIEPFRTRYVMAARIVLDEIIRQHTDLPVTVGAIVGDLDTAWSGTAESVAIAKQLYALDHVEPAIHTYSHPLDWEYFDPDRGGSRRNDQTVLSGPDVLHSTSSSIRRSYETRPFSLTREIDEAASFVNRLLPRGKRVGLVQWSGDTRPFPRILARARLFGLANINGGDTRFDREFPSAAWVSPIAYQAGGELQVYASNSNENTYTDLWRGRFFGFTFLSRTVKNTGAPRRLKPFNLYYHMYSGERLSSLNAVRANLTVARSLPLAPIEASRFSRIVHGFFTATIDQEGPRTWRVRHRGALQTLRFDDPSLQVDFGRSRGVIGQRQELGSLFVSLDEADDSPLVVLTRIGEGRSEPAAPVPYLVESRWRVYDVRHAVGRLQFATEGFGPGEARWHWPSGGTVEVRWRAVSSGRAGTLVVDADAAGLLTLRLPQLTGERVEVVMTSPGGVRHARG